MSTYGYEPSSMPEGLPPGLLAPPPKYSKRAGYWPAGWLSKNSASSPFGSTRCDWCKGALYKTLATRRPQQKDHKEGCEYFRIAAKVMQYAEGLQAAASDPIGGDASRSGREQRRYLQRSAKKLSEAACTGNPVSAVEVLAEGYGAEWVKGADLAAKMLMQACRQLAQGLDPEPIALPPG